ncbi:MAG: hypothetical protein IBX67_00605 [Dehalococcoidia bacterium]|nr:hypothetical protein [Dehalococcoidia bacterium]
MVETKPCCNAAAARMVGRLVLPDGSEVGIRNLEGILKEVAELKLTDDGSIRRELLKKVKIYNYVAPGAETDYSDALFSEYEKLAERDR